MRVLAVSVAPLFPGFVMGGSQRVLMDVVTGLGEAGHEVRVLCTQLPENAGGFSPAPGVTVEPSLRLRGAFPAPYETAPHLLADYNNDAAVNSNDISAFLTGWLDAVAGGC